MLSLASRRTTIGFSDVPLAFRYLDATTIVSHSTQRELLAAWRHSIYNSRANSEPFAICRSRSFTNSIWLQKNKKGKNLNQEEASQERYSSNKKDKTTLDSAATPLTDAIDLSSLKSEIQRIQEKLKNGLGRLLSGGRFNPVLIETLRVDVSKLRSAKDASDTKDSRPEPANLGQASAEVKRANKGKTRGSWMKPSTPTAPLTELAQIIPRGAKTVLIMLNEEAFAKPVMSALLSSPFSLNPSPSASNPLELILPLPPPSAQLRSYNLDQVDKLKERAEFALRDGRADTQKELRALQLGNQIRPDDYHDVSKKMEKTVEEAKAEIKRMCDASRKVLTS